MGAEEAIKKLLSIGINKYKEYKEKNESTLEWILITAIAKACLEEYPSYKIIYLEKDDKMLQAIEKIILEININDSVHMLKYESIDMLVKKMIEKNLINVTTNTGSELPSDLESFYRFFKGNILRISRELLEGNDIAVKDLLVSANIEEVKNIEELLKGNKQLLKGNEELKRLLEESGQAKDKEINNLENIKKIMVRNVKNGTEQIMEQCESTLDLSKYFDGRICRGSESWENIKREIEVFTDSLDCNVKYELNLAVYFTIAYYLGICLNSKSSREIRLIQISNGAKDWTPDFSNKDKEYSNFVVEEEKMLEGTGDLAICISITSDIKGDVTEYLNAQHIEVEKVVNFTLDKKIGNKSVENGNHAWNLAEEIKNWLNKRTIKEKKGNLHIFISAPVSIAFFLGQQSFGLANINLYEYTGILEEDEIYRKSIFISKGERL